MIARETMVRETNLVWEPSRDPPPQGTFCPSELRLCSFPREAVVQFTQVRDALDGLCDCALSHRLLCRFLLGNRGSSSPWLENGEIRWLVRR